MEKRSVFVALTWLAAASCGSDVVAPTLESIAGDYEATSFDANGDDVLAAGGSLTLSIDAAGSVSGTLFVPASLGGPLTADMSGTAVVAGAEITISQSADTFVRDASWTWADGVLTGSWSNSSDQVSVVLERR